MGKSITLRLDAQTGAQLEALSQALGFSEEMAVVYAVRLVGACIREGLIEDVPLRAWPKEVLSMGKVLAFPAEKTANAQSRV